MSFSHWRYRILHWFFGIEPTDRSSAEKSGVPSFFYSHYCPLFHFTNLLFLFFPVIIAFRGLKSALFAGYSLLESVTDRLNFSSEPTRAYKTHHDHKMIVDHIRRLFSKDWKHLRKLEVLQGHIEKWWKMYGEFCLSLKEDEAKQLYQTYFAKLDRQQSIYEIRAKKRRERLIFWVNFSRGFVRVLLWLVYLFLIGFILCVAYLFGWQVLSGFFWVTSTVARGVFSWSFLTVLLAILSAGLVLGVIFRYANLQYTANESAKNAEPSIASSAMKNLKTRLKNVQYGVVEFLILFYEDHCPPVKIVENKVDDNTLPLEEL